MLLEQVLGRKIRKEREQEWKRTQCLCAIGKKVAYNIFIASNRTLPNKAIKAIGINQPGQIGRINKSTNNKALLTQVFHLNIANA